MAIQQGTIDIADKTTSDQIKALLENTTYGLSALKNILGNSTYGLNAIKSAVSIAGTNAGKRLKFIDYYYLNSRSSIFNVSGAGIVMIQVGSRTSVKIDGKELRTDVLYLTDDAAKIYDTRRLLPIFFSNSVRIECGAGDDGLVHYWLYQ